MKKFMYPPKTTAKTKEDVAAVLWTLALDGPIVDEDGRATARMIEALERRDVDLPVNSLLRILIELGGPGLKGHDRYPYEYIECDKRGKRCYEIALTVDPEKVPFPANPWKAMPNFSRGTKARRIETPDPKETFSRQAQYTLAAEVPADPPPSDDPAPEPESIIEELDEPATVQELAPYEPESSVGTNGGFTLDDLELGPELLLPTDGRPRTAMGMVTAAISMLSDAVVLHADETSNGNHDGVRRIIDQHLGTHAHLRREITDLRDQLNRLQDQNAQLLRLAQRQKTAIEHLTARRNATT